MHLIDRCREAHIHHTNISPEVLSLLHEVAQRLAEVDPTAEQAKSISLRHANYTLPPEKFATVYPVAAFREMIESQEVDGDSGSAYAVKDGLEADGEMDMDNIPGDATHISWYSK